MTYYFVKNYGKFKVNDMLFAIPLTPQELKENNGKILTIDKEKARQLIQDGIIDVNKKVKKIKKEENTNI